MTGAGFWNGPGGGAPPADPAAVTVPEDHGAVGDGSTDDTIALQAWLDDARAFKLLPSNTYVTDPLDVPSDVTIFGRGTLKMRAQNVGSLGNHAVLQLFGSSGAHLSGIRIYDITVDHNASAMSGTTSSNMEAINANWTDGIILSGVTVLNSIADGIDLDNSTDGLVIGCTARNLGKAGIHVSTSCANMTVAFCLVVDSDGDPILGRGGINQVNSSVDCRFIGNEVRDSWRGYQIVGSGAVWIGNRTDNCTSANVLTGVDDFGGVDLTLYASAEGLAAGKIPESDGADGWTYIDTPTGGEGGRLLMADGVTAPPVPIETEAQDDWLYEG